jgi:hypothetical protein
MNYLSEVIWDKRKIFILMWLMILSACGGKVNLPLTHEDQNQPTQTVQVKIDKPVAESKVSYAERIKGRSQLLPTDKKIWIVIFPLAANSYYPQDRYVDIQPDGQWSSVAYIGIKDANIGESFDVIAVLVNSDAQEVFEKYSRESKAKQKWLGLENLPEGAQVYDRITVVRQ